MILGLHRHAVVGHADLSLAIEHVRRTDHPRDGVDFEPVAALVVGLDEGIRDVAIGSRVKVLRIDLEAEK